MSEQFHICPVEEAVVNRLMAELDLPRFVAATLVGRGVETPEQARAFLSPSIDRDWLNPYDLPGMTGVADVLERAIRAQKNIVVFGDFDLDGISATVVLTRGLREFGGHVTPFIPRRFEEGYALTEAAMERLCALDPKPEFVVTVDCGIACKDAVAALRARGIEVAVTDHHEPADLVPEGVPVADPKLDADCPSAILAGVGVALKLVQALGGRFGKPHLWREYTDFATLGTVADLMPMLRENRALVADGLRRMNEQPRVCLTALLGEAGAAGKPVTSMSLSFSAIPRLNAAGRMGDAELALRLLLSDDYEQAAELAAELERMNDMRRAIEAELSEIASAQAAEVYRGQRALVVAGAGWHEGVKGIVASRLVSTYGIPAILFTIDGDEARGSGRSVGSVNLFKAVESTKDLLTRFGGHTVAVGVTLPVKNLPAFAERLCAYMDALPEGAFHPMVRIDAMVALEELTIPNVEMLDRLAPFGQENPVPVFLTRNVTVANGRAVGQGKNHFSFTLTDGNARISSIMFHCKDIDALLANDGVVCAAYEVQIDEWRGRRSVKAMVRSLEPARSCIALEACLEPESKRFIDELYEDAEGADAPAEGAQADTESEAKRSRRDQWEALAAEDPDALEQAIIRALIGNQPLHDAQRSVLDCLNRDESVLAVMATGRGKSLIFHVHAALRALRDHTMSVFVYPLRALIADQAFHLSNALGRFGIASAVLTGEASSADRSAIYARARAGELDIVLTTPEFLFFHAQEFARWNVGFVVVDEAHHIGEAHAGHRDAYGMLGQVVASLRTPAPVVLALTATAPNEAARDITRILPITKLILDGTARENLQLNDMRNCMNRDDCLVSLVARGEKTVIYVNSREQSVLLARMLRKRVPHVAMMIGFYNAGLTRSERKRVEELFRTDRLTVLVATSAFGEGVNIPNIRHVVLYHLPFNEIEFNQMSGRAGRDGQPAQIHLLYDRRDASINEGILRDMTPDHDVMATVYRWLRQIQRENPTDAFSVGDAEFKQLASRRRDAVCSSSATCGISVFRELGLIESTTQYVDGEMRHSIRVIEGAAKVELTDSVRYCEGLEEREVFRSFCKWALDSAPCNMQSRVSHPIVPAEHELIREEDVHGTDRAEND